MNNSEQNNRKVQLVGIDEMAKLLSVPKSWLYDRTRMGPEAGFPFMKLGKYVRFDPDEVIAFFKSSGKEGDEQSWRRS
mgnify:CR=1 FL=1